MVTFSIDGLEVSAPEGAMLVDAAKYGDVEIPVFCYEPKLGQPVGACRMCLVEIEGIPKLQTGCSTPVRDGMVVHTQTDRVHDAQRAVVEFLLINHPLDCPVCDKGGECPLQDITYGWGPGTSRFIEPKRHFKKPLELSPLIAIDRERCILCYRCVRFSQEISEDYQLILLERGAHSYVGTFDGHPYVGPFSGNIIELCPVGALTSRAYRFRARPWDIEGAGTVCPGCPAHCNVELTVRDERVMRVLARDHPEVDDGWVCDRGRFGYQAVHVDERIVEPLVREGTELMPASWEKALAAADAALKKAGARAAAVAGGETTNEEAFLLQRLFRERLGSGHLASRPGGELPLDVARALADPALQATIPDLEFAHAVLVVECDPIDEAPVLDLRIRKGVRRHHVDLAVVSARPTALDSQARVVQRIAPGGGDGLLVALEAALAGDEGNLAGAATAAGSNAQAMRDLAGWLRDAGDDLVIVYGDRALRTPAAGARALLNLAGRLGLARTGAGLLEVPSVPNARGLREVGFAPGHGPGFSEVAEPGRDARGIAEGLADGELSTVWLNYADPVRYFPDRALWEKALGTAQSVIAVETLLTDTVREHADVVFPGEAYPEKEGTVTNLDGRVQRLRVAIGRPKGRSGLPGTGVRPLWQVISDLGDLGVLTGAAASQQVFEAVPFYAGLTLDEIGGRGVRWPQRMTEWQGWEGGDLDVPPAAPAAGDGRLRLGTFRSLWAAKEVDVSPILQFLIPQPTVELSPADADKLGVREGERVEVGTNGTRIEGTVKLRAAVPAGSVFVGEGVRGAPANLLGEPLVEVRRPGVIVFAEVGYAEPWWAQLLKALVIFAVVFQLVPIVLLGERKLLGRFQHRYGPNRVGPFGALQPIADIGKLIFKEQFRPRTATGWLFAIAPVISMVTAVATVAIIPFSNTVDIFGTEIGLYGVDPSIGILYAFAFGAIAFYGLMLGGWASGSKYSFLGSMRAAAQLISYEVAQGLSIVGVLMMAGSLSMVDIVEAQDGDLWFFIPQFVGFIIFMVASFAETNRPPFDLAEADAELVGGYNTEYGGGRFAAFFAAEYLNVIVVSGIAVTLFLGGWNIPWVDPPTWVDPIVVIVKMLALVFFFIWVRATLPRLRYDQLMALGWKIFLPLATLNALVTAILVVET